MIQWPKILFEDNHLIVLDKPPGLLSQGEKTGKKNVVDWLRDYWGRPYVGLIHRLDRNTSGVMVVAKRTKAARRLTESLVQGQLKRIYLAWVWGALKKPQNWRHYLKKDKKKNKVCVVAQNERGVQEARLQVVPVKTVKRKDKSLTLAQFSLQTGRSHQIRVQSSYQGHALVGDVKYGEKDLAVKRPLLHSWKIEFPHPMNQGMMQFESSLPKDMKKI